MASVESQLTTYPFLEDQPGGPLISYGAPFPEACRFHVDSTIQASKVYLLLSGSLARNSDDQKRLEQALGDKIVGVRVGMKPHTLWSEVLEVVEDARPLDLDCLISVGGGSLTDAAKVIVWALANDVRSTQDLEKLSRYRNTSSRDQDDLGDDHLKPPTIKHIAVPSSLSGGEFTPFAGATNDQTKAKVLFTPPAQNPAIVVLDPEIAASTPSRLFLATGIRAVDHCVETLCSLQSNEKADQAGIRGLEMLVPALLTCKREPGNLDATRQAQLGAAEAIKTSLYGVEKGGSHAIGHQLGPLGVPHGETSCVLLPGVCQWNASKGANVERQQSLARVLIGLPEVRKIVAGGKEDLPSILDALIRALGLPRTLKEVNVGRETFDIVAENTLADMWAKTNPVPLLRKEDVLEILEIVAE